MSIADNQPLCSPFWRSHSRRLAQDAVSSEPIKNVFDPLCVAEQLVDGRLEA